MPTTKRPNQRRASVTSSLGRLPKHRGDLEVYSHVRRGKTVWVLKDPITLKYFQFSPEEFFVFRHLDGRHSVAEIRDRFQQEYIAQRISENEVTSFITRLQRSGLVLAKRSGQGDRLWKNAQAVRWRERLATLSNPLAIRFPGINPGRLIDAIYVTIRGLFSPLWLGIAAAWVLFVGVWFANANQAIRERLPDLDAFLSPSNLVVLGIVMAATKVIHELAHAVTCRHFGGRCHEMGVMLLLLTPCLYCDVTDSWTLRDRRHRVWISAAGMLAELWLASVAAMLWWFTSPGLLSTICLNVMVICSIGTLMINANPLLRYDGYFILSDLFDVPNLWQRSQQQVRSLLQRGLFGDKLSGRSFAPGWTGISLLAFGFASLLYRCLVVSTVLLLVHRYLAPRGMELIASLVIGLLIVGISSSSLLQLFSWVRHPGRRRMLMSMSFMARIVVGLVFLGALLFVPVPCRLRSVALLEGARTRQVFVTVPGVLKEHVPIGQFVSAGTPLATLENLPLDRELESLRSQVSGQRQRLKTLHAIRGNNEAIASQIPAATETLQDLQEQLLQLQQDCKALTLVSPVDGIVLPAAAIEKSNEDNLELVTWQGRPTDRENLDAYLTRQTVFCLVGEPNQTTAIAYVDQTEIGLVAPGQSVTVILETLPGVVRSGVVSEVGQVNLDQVPKELVAQQWIASRQDEFGAAIPVQTLYPVAIRLEEVAPNALIGGRATVKIHVASQPLMTQLTRMIRKTFPDVL